jgi:hypothetical protein
MAWGWDLLKDLAAAKLATGSSDEEVCRETGRTLRTLQNWKNRPEFAEKVKEIRDRAAETLAKDTIADLQRRIDILDGLAKDLLTIKNEQGAQNAEKYPGAPGIKTGLVLPVIEIDGEGKVHVNFAKDFKLTKEIRDTLKDVAVQLGQLGKDDDGKGPTYVIELD